MNKNTGKVYKTKPTQKQQIAIDSLVESRGIIAGAMRVAEYKEKTIKNPKNLTESKAYKEALPDILERLRTERDEALREAKKKRGRAGYNHLIEAVDKLTKNIQLLSGGATEKVINIQISQEIASKNDVSNQPPINNS